LSQELGASEATSLDALIQGIKDLKESKVVEKLVEKVVVERKVIEEPREDGVLQ
jgi:hypothetical protein